MMTTNEARTAYKTTAREIVAATGWTPAEVNRRVAQYAHEMADGEEITPFHWVEGAAELQYLVSKGKVA